MTLPKFVFRRRALRVGAAAVLALGALMVGPGAQAQAVPASIKLLIPFAPGGPTDIFGRLAADALRTHLKTTVVTENRVGGNGAVAVNAMKLGPADGSNLLFVSSGMITFSPLIDKSMSWDPQKDLVPIISLAQTDIGLIVAANVPANDLNEFLQLARRARPPLSLGSAGQGNILHAYIELLKDATKADFLHVPYKGAADVAKDFVTGRVHLQFASSSAAQALARSGEVRLLGVVAPKRSDLFPELKTMSELGIQGMDIDTSLGLLGPAGMAPPVVARIADAARAVMGLSQVRSEFRTGGVEPQWAGPADYAQTLRDAYTGWGKLLAAVGYKKQ